MKSKRGQGNTFWIIIAAALAILVLVVLIVIFTGKTSEVKTTLSQCGLKGGVCQPNACSGEQIQIGEKGCTDNGTYQEDYYCCSKK